MAFTYIDPQEAIEQFEEHLNSTGVITIAGVDLYPSDILEEMCPAAYREEFNNWMYMMDLTTEDSADRGINLAFKTENVIINGTSLQGYIRADYDQLVKVFGKPVIGPDADEDKITCEWQLEYEDGTVATIYDYKLRSTPYHMYEWHIGGYNTEVVHRVHKTFSEAAYKE